MIDGLNNRLDKIKENNEFKDLFEGLTHSTEKYGGRKIKKHRRKKSKIYLIGTPKLDNK